MAKIELEKIGEIWRPKKPNNDGWVWLLIIVGGLWLMIACS